MNNKYKGTIKLKSDNFIFFSADERIPESDIIKITKNKIVKMLRKKTIFMLSSRAATCPKL